MSIGQSIIASTSGFIIFLILGLVMAPMLIFVPLAILVLIWEAIGSIDTPIYRDLAYCAFFWTLLLIAVIKTSHINWFRRHIYRLPELKE